MNRFIHRIAYAAPAMAVAMMLAIPAAQAQKTEPIEGGRTAVTLASGFATTLSGLGVKLNTSGACEHRHGSINFPVIGGAIDLDTGIAEVLHGGGLNLTVTTSSGTTEVQLLDFIVDTTGSSPVITGLVSVNGTLSSRAVIFDLTLPAITLPLTPEHSTIQFESVGVALDAAAATALNTAFGLTGSNALTAGTAVGTANVTLVLPWMPEHRK